MYNLVHNVSSQFNHQSTNAEIEGEYFWHQLDCLHASTSLYGLSKGYLPSFAVTSGYTGFWPDWPTQLETHSGFLTVRAEELIKYAGLEVEFSGDWGRDNVHRFKTGAVTSIGPVRATAGYQLTNCSTTLDLHGAYLSLLWKDGIVSTGFNFTSEGFHSLNAEMRSFNRPVAGKNWYFDYAVALKYEPYALVLLVQLGFLYARDGWRLGVAPFFGMVGGASISRIPYGAWEDIIDFSNIPSLTKDFPVGLNVRLSWGHGDDKGKSVNLNHTANQLSGVPHGIAYTGLLEEGRLRR